MIGSIGAKGASLLWLKASKRVLYLQATISSRMNGKKVWRDAGEKNRVKYGENRHGGSRQAKIARNGTQQEIVPMVEGKGRMPSSRSWVTRSGLTGY
jgi:hypothetical protein